MDIVPSTAPNSLTSDTTFSNYLLIVDAYSKIPKLCGIDNITTEEVMEKLDMFQSRFDKIRLTLAAPEHQEMNRQVEVTWRTLRTVPHSLM